DNGNYGDNGNNGDNEDSANNENNGVNGDGDGSGDGGNEENGGCSGNYENTEGCNSASSSFPVQSDGVDGDVVVVVTRRPTSATMRVVNGTKRKR
ncbi:hypothetical protein KPH14_013107, partial [Odynerus spinipes]